jgi:hypothetical protein
LPAIELGVSRRRPQFEPPKSSWFCFTRGIASIELPSTLSDVGLYVQLRWIAHIFETISTRCLSTCQSLHCSTSLNLARICFGSSILICISLSNMSSRSSTSTPLSQDYYIYLFYEQIGQGLEERLEPAPTSSNDEAHQTLRYSPASTDESNGQRSDKCHAIHRKPVAIASILVSWNGPQDPQNPMNWSSRRKTLIVAAICCISFSISFSGGLFAPAALTVAAEFGVNEEVALLGVSLYVLGFAAGKHKTFPTVVGLAS